MKVRKFAQISEQAKAKPHIGQVFHGKSTPNLSSSGALPSISLNLIMQNIIIEGQSRRLRDKVVVKPFLDTQYVCLFDTPHHRDDQASIQLQILLGGM